MDLVEARKKAKELQEKKQETPAAKPVMEKPESPALEKPSAKKVPGKKKRPGPEAKARPAAKKTEAKKAKAGKKTEPVPVKKAKAEKTGGLPEPKPAAKPAPTPPAKTEPAPTEELFVDMNFGEDLPDLTAKEKKPAREEKRGEAPKQKQEAISEKKVEKQQAPAKSSELAPPAVLEPDSDKDFYELVVEDLVQYGYGEIESEADLVELLGLRLGSEIYAISLVKIQQIIKPRSITLVPGSPHYVLGIVSLRGMVIPIFDLRKRLGLEPVQPTRQTRIIIVKVKDSVLAGLYVDQVLEVARVPQSSFEAPHSIFSGAEGEFLEGIARYKNQMLIVLNLANVVLGKEEERKAG